MEPPLPIPAIHIARIKKIDLRYKFHLNPQRVDDETLDDLQERRSVSRNEIPRVRSRSFCIPKLPSSPRVSVLIYAGDSDNSARRVH